MNDLERWQESNARQLSAAVVELRQRLERYIQQQSGSASAAVSSIATPATDEAVEKGENETAGELEELPSALNLLSERLSLSTFERDILLLCAAMELDTRVAALCARAQDDPNKPFPTFALVLALFDDASWDALSPERPLRYWRLLEINQPGAQPLTGSALRADERIVNYLKGLNCLDDRVSSFIAPLEIDPAFAQVAPSQNAAVETVLRCWQREIDAGPLPIVQLLGPDPISKQLVAHQAAVKLNRILCRLPVEVLPSATQDLETFIRLWQRESRLLPLAFYLDAEDTDAAAMGRSGALHRFLARTDGFCFLAVREALAQPGREHIALDVGKPAASEQQSAWSEELGSSAPESPGLLAAQFNLNLPTPKLHLPAERTPATRRARAAAGAKDDLGRSRLAARRNETAARNRRPGPATKQGLRRLGIRAEDEPRLWHQRPLCRRQRLRQNHGGGSHRERAAPESVSDRSLRRREQIHRRDREKPAPSLRRGGGRRARSCFSTRPTRSSASAAK